MQSENALNEIIWDPIKIFECPLDYNFALIILNSPILLKHDILLSMWDKGKFYLFLVYFIIVNNCSVFK